MSNTLCKQVSRHGRQARQQGLVAHSPSRCRISTYGTLKHGALMSASKLRSYWTVLRCGGRGRLCVADRRAAHCAAFTPRAHAPCLARYRSDLFLDSASRRANVELVSNIRFVLLISGGNKFSSFALYCDAMFQTRRRSFTSALSMCKCEIYYRQY